MNEQIIAILRDHTPSVMEDYCECCGGNQEWTCDAKGCKFTTNYGLAFAEHLIELIKDITPHTE